jgi:hypothetical protein
LAADFWRRLAILSELLLTLELSCGPFRRGIGGISGKYGIYDRQGIPGNLAEILVTR